MKTNKVVSFRREMYIGRLTEAIPYKAKIMLARKATVSQKEETILSQLKTGIVLYFNLRIYKMAKVRIYCVKIKIRGSLNS